MAEGSKLGWIAGVLGAGLLGLVAGQFYTLSTVRSLTAEIETLRLAQAEAKQALDSRLAQLGEGEAAAGTERAKALETLQTGVDAARREAAGAAGAAGRVQRQIQANIESLSARLDANERKIQESQERLTSELAGVRQASAAAESGIDTVSAGVAAVKSEVASTRTQVTEAVATLDQRTRTDLREIGGQIATNAAEIEALRARGERDYLEFTVFKSRDPVRVGGISLLLKKTDVKNGRYSVDLYMNDLKLEKKDRNINEPLQFFLPGERQAHELVVNQVSQDQITGYVASPKSPARSPATSPASAAR